MFAITFVYYSTKVSQKQNSRYHRQSQILHSFWAPILFYRRHLQLELQGPGYHWQNHPSEKNADATSQSNHEVYRQILQSQFFSVKKNIFR